MQIRRGQRVVVEATLSDFSKSEGDAFFAVLLDLALPPGQDYEVLGAMGSEAFDERSFLTIVPADDEGVDVVVP